VVTTDRPLTGGGYGFEVEEGERKKRDLKYEESPDNAVEDFEQPTSFFILSLHASTHSHVFTLW